MPTVRNLLEPAAHRLANSGVERPRREAALLLRTLLGMSESALLAHDRDPVPSDVAERFRRRIEARAQRTPAAYLLGEREFFGRGFVVDPRVLIPRPETEGLVELALRLPLPPRARVLDLATGSGCIAVSLAVERPAWQIVASDLSPAALAVARLNAARHRATDRVQFVAADLVRGLEPSGLHLVVVNPPYIDADARAELAPEIRDHEPHRALFAGSGGLELFARLFAELDIVMPGGYLASELGAGQADAVTRLAASSGRWQLIERIADLSSFDRHLLWRRIR